jgi:hypothetical protein
MDGTITNANLWHDAPVLGGGQMTFVGADHTYEADLTFSTGGASPDRNTTHFAPVCLVANGGNPTCDDLAMALAKFYAPANATPQPPASFQNIQCASTADGGCDCTYVYVVQVIDKGNWSVSGSTLREDSALFTLNGQENKPLAPTRSLQATFCAQGGQLQLTGAQGSSLSGLLGLRTMILSAM